MRFQELKINILEYLGQHQEDDYIDSAVLERIFKKSSYKNIGIACEKLIEEGLAEKYKPALEGGKYIHSIKITKTGIDFLNSNESSAIARANHKINKKTYYATIAIVIVSTIGVLITLIPYINLPKKINPIRVTIENKTVEIITINPINDFRLWFPSNAGYSFIEGKCEFVANGIVEIPAGESISLDAQVLNIDKFYDYYNDEDCEIQLWLQVNGKSFESNNLPFSKNWLKKYYTEIVVSGN